LSYMKWYEVEYEVTWKAWS